MLMPADAPGTPMRSSKVGASVCSSKPDGGVEHSRRVGRINLQRGVVGGDDAEARRAPEVVGNGHGQRRALFGIGRRTQLVEQHQRMRGRLVRDEIDVGDVRRKGREVLLDRLVVADVGEHRIEDRQLGALGRDRNARLRHQRQQTNGLQRHGLAAGVGTADDDLAMLAVELDGERNDGNAPGFQRPLQQRMARVAQDERIT